MGNSVSAGLKPLIIPPFIFLVFFVHGCIACLSLAPISTQSFEWESWTAARLSRLPVAAPGVLPQGEGRSPLLSPHQHPRSSASEAGPADHTIISLCFLRRILFLWQRHNHVISFCPNCLAGSMLTVGPTLVPRLCPTTVSGVRSRFSTEGHLDIYKSTRGPYNGTSLNVSQLCPVRPVW